MSEPEISPHDLEHIHAPRRSDARKRCLIYSVVWSERRNNVSGEAMWWGENHSGYTGDINRAGRYGVDEAKAIADACGGDVRVFTEDEVRGLPSKTTVDVGDVRKLRSAATAQRENK